jgi:hypothetical protein
MSMDSLLQLVIYVIVIGAVCWLLWWLIGFVGIPEPFAKIARGIVAVVAVVFLINLLLHLVPGAVSLKH